MKNAGILVIPAFFRVLGYNTKNSDANNQMAFDAGFDANKFTQYIVLSVRNFETFDNTNTRYCVFILKNQRSYGTMQKK